MANITQLQITGSSTIHNLNDARISATAVTTATHVLTANSGVTSIAPIAVADLASVLGAMTVAANRITDAYERIGTTGIFVDCATNGTQISNSPEKYGACITISKSGNGNPAVLFWTFSGRLYVAASWMGITTAWKQLI